jgi:cation:H+ antiporter
MISLLGLFTGIVLLIAGGALLVRGSSEIATRFGVSPMIVGLTIVGFGTSTPELVVNIVGSLKGVTGLAFGNVVGSNISNLALVLGVAALIKPISIQGQLVRREVPLLLLATTMMTVMALDGPLHGLPAVIGRSESIVLMLLFCIFIYVNALDIVGERQADPLVLEIEADPLIDTHPIGRFAWLLVILGVGLLYAGGEMTVRNSVEIAGRFGVSATIVGLFMVAVGTSMPELVTSVIAAIRGESDLALGNVVGSSIFNSLVVLPASGLISEVPVPRGGIGDLLVSWALVALLIPIFIMGKARLGRVMGGMLLLAYFAFVVVRISYDNV